MDEIVEKYGLKLHTGSRIPAEMDALRAAFGDFTTAENWGGYYFEDGTISFDGEQELEGLGKVNFQFHRAMKGVFDTVSLGIEFIDDYEQWDYVTASGKQVLLAFSEEGGLILLDDDDCFVTIHALTWDTDGQAIELSKAKLEALADTFDFSLL